MCIQCGYCVSNRPYVSQSDYTCVGLGNQIRNNDKVKDNEHVIRNVKHLR